jgi:polysaccharide transporter, PST family
MIHKINKLKKNKLIKNFSYLTIIELSNYILPFITIPYIVRVIGIEYFGVITFAYALIAYFQLIVNYGFKLIATKYISINREDINKMSKYFWTVIFCQLILLVLSMIIFSLVLFNIEQISNEKLIFIYSFGLVISSIIFPIWFFQGIENMKYVAIFNLIARSFYTILIFIFIQDKSNYELIPLFNSVSFILVGLVSLVFIKTKFRMSFYYPTLYEIKEQFIEGWYLFLSTITNNLYTTTNTVLLGFITNYSVVGIYSLASTISTAITKIIKIFNQVVYPHLANLSNNKELLIEKSNKFFKLYLFILVISTFLLFIFSDLFINILFGKNHDESVIILQLLALTLLVEPLGGFFTALLVIKNEKREIVSITFKTMILNFILIFPTIFLFQAMGMAITKLLVESYQVFLNINKNKEIIYLKKASK